MKTINETIEKVYGNYPEKILQFGEGNFLRAFVDWMIDKANRDGIYQGSIVLCQPIAQGLKNMINAQDGVYTRSSPLFPAASIPMRIMTH